MKLSSGFFNFDLHQLVNSWLCITLISLMCLWVALFYYLDRGDSLAHNFVGSYARNVTSLDLNQ